MLCKLPLRHCLRLQDVNETDMEVRRAGDAAFAGLHPQIQAAVMLVERFADTLYAYGDFMGHPHRSVSPECARLAFFWKLLLLGPAGNGSAPLGV